MTKLLVAASVAAVSLLNSCSTATSRDSQSLTSTTVTASSRIRSEIPAQTISPPSPLLIYRLDEEQQRLAFDTWQELMHRCMAKVGFEFSVTNFMDTVSNPKMATSYEDVVRFGYDLLPGTDTLFVSPNDQRVATDPEYQAAFVGDPDDPNDGCRGISDREVYNGDYWSLELQIEEEMIEASQVAEAQPQYAELDNDWSGCMASSGFKYDTPGDTLSKFAGGGISNDEVETRLADLVCQADLSYQYTVGSLTNEAAQAWMAQNQQLLKDVSNAKDAYLRRLSTLRQDLGL